MKEDEFYIGYLTEMPEKHTRIIRFSVAVLGLFVIISGLILSLYQNRFSKAVYEEEEVVLQGVVYQTPVPMFKVLEGKNQKGESLIGKTLLLVNQGKFGAGQLINDYEKKLADKPENYLSTLKGNLMYDEGKSVLQLNTGENSFLNNKILPKKTGRIIRKLGKSVLQGEIVDAKCYFGTMKPGFSKPHRSCAIRCISGGIPPVLAEMESGKKVDFYLILGENGEMINNELLDYVADFSSFEGEVLAYDDWKVIRLHPKKDIKVLKYSSESSLSSNRITLCR